MDTNFMALVLGTFLSETVKNVAKGTANWIAENGNSLFQTEIIALGLSESATPEEIAEKLKAKPEMIQLIEQKVEASPDFVKALFEETKTQVLNNMGNLNNINAKNIGTVITDSHAPIKIKNKFS